MQSVRPCKLLDLTAVENFNDRLRMSKRKSRRPAGKWSNKLLVQETLPLAMKHGARYSQLAQLNIMHHNYNKHGTTASLACPLLLWLSVIMWRFSQPNHQCQEAVHK